MKYSDNQLKLLLLKKNDHKLIRNDVLLYCSKNMEAFMIPKEIKFLEVLPKSPNGKVDKKQLKLINEKRK